MNNFKEETQKESSKPLLPRSGWEDEQAFLKAIIRAKQALDMAELTAMLWQPKSLNKEHF